MANTYNEYDILNAAKVACISDEHCIAVSDDNCDKTGKFRLCKQHFRIPQKSTYPTDCIYKKKSYEGTI